MRLSFAPWFLVLLLHSSLAARDEWSTSRLQGSPELPKPFVAEPIWETLTWDRPLEMIPSPGTDHAVIVVEQGGRYTQITPGAPPTSHLLIDLQALHPELKNAYGIAFHPDFPDNRSVYLTYTFAPKLDDGSRLSRFQLSQTSPPVIDPLTEEVLLTWRSGGHNGAALRFGPDGMLYLSTGDSEVPSPPDPLHTGQDNSDLLSCILRIDVDQPGTADRPYGIPADNPFLDRPNYRPEIWAYGFRNPWKIAFDDQGRLWCGDVGWELWEMVHLVPKGGNHGWSATEARQPVHPIDATADAILPPVAAHPHTEAASMTGGLVYRGSSLPELTGGYVYGDYETGKVWALWHDGTTVTRRMEVADTGLKIVSFGEDPAGELYLIHYGTPGSIHRLSANPDAGRISDFPRRLSETGLFADVASQTPQTGVYPYRVKQALWNDGATAQRWVAFPDQSGVTTKPKGNLRTRLDWPENGVLARTLSWGDSPTATRIETQILHFDGRDWQGYTYAWRADQTDADLVPAQGSTVTLQIPGEKGNPKSLPWRYGGRGECLRCHNDWNGFALGFQAEQLDGLQLDGEWQDPEATVALGLCDSGFLDRTPTRLAGGHDASAPPEDSVRSYLHANCSTCHRQGGGGSVTVFFDADTPVEKWGAIDTQPMRGTLGVDPAAIVAPGAPWRSVLLHRMSRHGSGHMPMTGAQEVDEEAIRLLWDWIADLPQSPDAAVPASVIAADRAALEHLLSQSAGPSAVEAADLATVIQLAQACTDPQLPHRSDWITAGLNSEASDKQVLFERFRSPEDRPDQIGPAPDPLALLSRSGDSARGASMVTPTGKLATCLACHSLPGVGGIDFGPSLVGLGARASREQILDSLLHPSAQIVPGYATTTLTTTDGRTLTGFVTEETTTHRTLRLPGGLSETLPTASIATASVQPQSLMPEGLIQSLTAQEAADLLAWLHQL